MVVSEDTNDGNVDQREDQEQEEQGDQYLVIGADPRPQLLHRISRAMNPVKHLISLLLKMLQVFILKNDLLKLF